MSSDQKIQEILGVILIIGVTLSLVLVMSGGFLFIYQHAGLIWENELQQIEMQPITISIWSLPKMFLTGNGELALIETGLLLLIFTQIVRVACLIFYYAAIKDLWFTAMSLFIFIALIYGFFW